MPVFDPLTQACLKAFDGRLLLWVQERATSRAAPSIRDWVIEQADFASAYFEQTDGSDMWDAWVDQKLATLIQSLSTEQEPTDLMAELDGWEEVLGPQRLIREMLTQQEDDEPLMAHLLRQPTHHDRIRRGLEDPKVLHNALMQAIRKGDDALLIGLLAVGVSPNGLNLTHSTWQDLPLSCMCDTPSRTRQLHDQLLACGANVNHYADWRSLLHGGAILKNDVDWAQWLIEHGAKMPTWNHEGRFWSSLDSVRQIHQDMKNLGQVSPWEPMLHLLETLDAKTQAQAA